MKGLHRPGNASSEDGTAAEIGSDLLKRPWTTCENVSLSLLEEEQSIPGRTVRTEFKPQLLHVCGNTGELLIHSDIVGPLKTGIIITLSNALKS